MESRKVGDSVGGDVLKDYSICSHVVERSIIGSQLVMDLPIGL